jgi:tRNA dimethylallyltransferase
MEATPQRPKLLVIVGPTASGKSGLALRIAKKFNGEIIAADSRTIYKGMNIGTAKPSEKEQKQVPHWGLDLVEPGNDFSAHRFKEYAEDKISDVHNRGNLPILVGGTGLYIDSVLFDFGFVPPSEEVERGELEKLSVGQLQEVIKQKGYKMPENSQNRRHLTRAIERKGEVGIKKQSLKGETLVAGLLLPSEILKEHIKARAENYFKNGLEQETKYLLDTYGEKALRKSGGIAYQVAIEAISGKISKEEAVELIRKQEWQYARRQRTWFKRNKFVTWFESPEQAYQAIAAILNN